MQMLCRMTYDLIDNITYCDILPVPMTSECYSFEVLISATFESPQKMRQHSSPAAQHSTAYTYLSYLQIDSSRDREHNPPGPSGELNVFPTQKKRKMASGSGTRFTKQLHNNFGYVVICSTGVARFPKTHIKH
jgi:hypothetical protein